MRRWALLLLGGCAPGGPETPCEADGEPTLEVVPTDLAFGAFVDGDPLLFGPPPQGGAPYTPLKVRASGLAGLGTGATIDLWGSDLEGEDLGEVSYETRFVCANVGDSAGTWVASDVHFRYFGWDLDALGGRIAELTTRVTDTSGAELEVTLQGPLTPM